MRKKIKWGNLIHNDKAQHFFAGGYLALMIYMVTATIFMYAHGQILPYLILVSSLVITIIIAITKEVSDFIRTRVLDNKNQLKDAEYLDSILDVIFTIGGGFLGSLIGLLFDIMIVRGYLI